jgi:hypothetical protein
MRVTLSYLLQRENLQIQKENTGKENRMLNWVRAGYGLETSVIVGMSSDQFYGGNYCMTGHNSRYLFPPLFYSNAS